MTTSPTPAELTAIKVGYAALLAAKSPMSHIVEQVVFAIGATGMLQSPESASEIARDVRAQVMAEAGPELKRLRAERHSTNEALAEVTVACRATETERDVLRAQLRAVRHLVDEERAARITARTTVDRIGVAVRPGEPGTGPVEQTPAELTVYRASHDSIVMGHYTTRQAAYEHCEAYETREDPVSPMAWNVDEDGVADLVRIRVPRSPGAESATGYVVTPVEIASEYDPEVDE